jgi:hypothetical protein
MDISPSGVAEQKRITVCFCSAREDEKLLNELKKHLHPLQRQELIELWHDRAIKAGSEWKPEIKKRTRDGPHSFAARRPGLHSFRLLLEC